MASNVVSISADDASSASLVGETLVLDHFVEHDSQVVALAKEAGDLEFFTHNALAIGARALAGARVTGDVAVVEKAFDGLTDTFDRRLEQFTGEIDAKSEELIGDDGVLTEALEALKRDLDLQLGEAFDPESKKSVIAKIETAVRTVGIENVKAIRNLVDPENSESPLARYKTEIVGSVEKETEKLRKDFEELRKLVAVEEAKAEIFELSSKKGFAYEDILEPVLVSVCGPRGDVAERVGGTPGARGKKGDFKVTLNTDDTAGRDACFAVEAKDKQMKLREVLDELDKAITNRGALAAIAVFARPHLCPCSEVLEFYGNRALVTYDKDGDDGLALRLAITWARWFTRRQLGGPSETIDTERIGALIDDARRSLLTHSTINKALTTSSNKISDAKKHLATMIGQIEAALGEIEGELAA